MGIKYKRLLIALLLAVMVFSSILPSYENWEEKEIVDVTVRLEEYGSGIPIDKSLYYGRGALSALENSEAMLYAYDRIAEGVESSLQKIDVYNGTSYLSAEEFCTVLDAYRRDYTEHFWLGNEYTMSTNAFGVVAIKMNYVMSGDELSSARDAFDTALSTFTAGISSEMSDFEKELYLHDALAVTVEYRESKNAHNAYGALVEGVAVCEGYAEALQCLLRSVGIESYLAHGSSYNPQTGISEPHAWNYVKIGERFYHTDLTWNDQGENVFHAYFNLTDAEIGEDHVIDSADYALPVCNFNDMSYFTVNGGIFSSATYTIEAVGARMKAAGGRESFYITDGVVAFTEWFDDNARDIADTMGIFSSLSYGFRALGKEVIVTMNYCKHNNMLHTPPSSPSCTDFGNIEYYACTDCGRYFKNNSATVEIVDKNSVTLRPNGHKYTVKILDSDHVKSLAVDCTAFDEFWYECSECGSISDTKHFASENRGPHSTALSKGDASGHYEQCQKCHDKAPVSPHLPNISEPTATEAVVCTECGYIISPSLSHTEHIPSEVWLSDESSHWHACVGCESQKLESGAHSDKDGDGACDICARQGIASDTDNNSAYTIYQNIMNKLAEYGISPPMLIFGASGLLILIVIISKISKR